jgi:hypothetical protein
VECEEYFDVAVQESLAPLKVEGDVLNDQHRLDWVAALHLPKEQLGNGRGLGESVLQGCELLEALPARSYVQVDLML